MFVEEKIEELLVKLFVGAITPDEKISLKIWVNENTQNRAYYEEMKNVWQGTHPAFSPESIDVLAAEKTVMAITNKNKFIHSAVFVWWQRVAAILLLPVVMVMGYLLYDHPSRSTAIAFQEISSPFGMCSKVDLPDGTTVWLNSGSKLKYPVVFASNERNVYLSGEGYFQVHSDKKHPFVVQTDKLNVTATGTKFNVEAYAADSITAVTLLEGKIDVHIDGIAQENLQPNERIVFNSISEKYSLSETNTQQWGLWKDGILAFRDEPLGDVFKRIGRTYNVDIRIEDNIVGKQPYRATFEGESLEEILRLLKMTAPIEYKRFGREKQKDNAFNKERIEVYKAN